MIIKKIKYLIVLCLFFTQGCQNYAQDKMKIISDPLHVQVDSFNVENKLFISKSIYFIIEEYNDTKLNEFSIDSFVCGQIDNNYKEYSDYTITIFNKTDKTNFEYTRKNPRELDRHSLQQDLLYQYNWTNGIFIKKNKYKGTQDPIESIKIFSCEN